MVVCNTLHLLLWYHFVACWLQERTWSWGKNSCRLCAQSKPVTWPSHESKKAHWQLESVWFDSCSYRWEWPVNRQAQVQFASHPFAGLPIADGNVGLSILMQSCPLADKHTMSLHSEWIHQRQLSAVLRDNWSPKSLKPCQPDAMIAATMIVQMQIVLCLNLISGTLQSKASQSTMN